MVATSVVPAVSGPPGWSGFSYTQDLLTSIHSRPSEGRATDDLVVARLLLREIGIPTTSMPNKFDGTDQLLIFPLIGKLVEHPLETRSGRAEPFDSAAGLGQV